MQDDGPAGDAARVFEDLRAEVSVLRRAVEALPQVWEANRPPDYSESLGQITQGLIDLAACLQAIERHPSIRLTPAQHQAALVAVSQEQIGRSVGRIEMAANAFHREHKALAELIGTLRGRREQWKWLGITAAIALVSGLLLSTIVTRAFT